MSRHKPRPIPGMKYQIRPVRELLKHPQGVNAIHEASHGVVAALLDTPGFESVDLQLRTRETHPDAGIPPGSRSRGFTKIIWPQTITKGCSWKRALGAIAPGVTANTLHYKDDGIGIDAMELSSIGDNDLGIGQDKIVRVAWRLTGQILSNTAVLTAIIRTAFDLLDRTSLSADEVRSNLMQAQAVPPGYPVLLSAEVLSLIGLPDPIEKHDEIIAHLAAAAQVHR
jgi:hypothetical protein